MAVKKISDKDGKLILEFENGDREKFQTLLHDWNFKDEQSILRFMMAILGKSVDNTVGIYTQNGLKAVVPEDELLNK